MPFTATDPLYFQLEGKKIGCRKVLWPAVPAGCYRKPAHVPLELSHVAIGSRARWLCLMVHSGYKTVGEKLSRMG